jgi:hypothetical protein
LIRIPAASLVEQSSARFPNGVVDPVLWQGQVPVEYFVVPGQAYRLAEPVAERPDDDVCDVDQSQLHAADDDALRLPRLAQRRQRDCLLAVDALALVAKSHLQDRPR